jgi:AcrR family transcriptional regulator
MGNREKLLAGAKRCIHEKGFARTTARDLVAASGTNLASIGYHFGSKEALLTQALVEELGELVEKQGEWSDELACVLSAAAEGGPLQRLESMWTRVIESFSTHRALWFASFQAFAEAERSPELRQMLAAGYEIARPWMVAMFLGTDENTVDQRTARTTGSFLLALQAGLAAQWLLDPAHSPSGHDVADALRMVLAAVEPAEPGRELR